MGGLGGGLNIDLLLHGMVNDFYLVYLIELHLAVDSFFSAQKKKRKKEFDSGFPLISSFDQSTDSSCRLFYVKIH